MTRPLAQIIFDRDLLRKLPFYARNLAREQRRRILRTVGERYGWSRLLVDSVAIVDWDAPLGPAIIEHPEQRVHGISNFVVGTPRREYPVVDERSREFLRFSGLPDTHLISAPCYTFELSDAVLQMDDGVVCTSDLRMLEDSVLGRLHLTASSAYAEPKPDPPYLRGTYSSIWCPHAENHYHWLVDALQRLYSLRQATGDPITLLMPHDLLPARRQMLDWCLPANISVRYVPRSSWWRAERFIFPSLTVDWSRTLMPEAHTRYVRERILEAVGLPDRRIPGNRRIYISRPRAVVRRLKNEAALVARLAGYGFEPYVLDDMTIEEQVRLFHEAQCVVGPHGAGMANMLFAGSIPIVEFIWPQFSPTYFMIAQVLGQEHRFVAPLPDKRVRVHQDTRMRDLSVSIDDVEREVREALRSPLLVGPNQPATSPAPSFKGKTPDVKRAEEA